MIQLFQALETLLYRVLTAFQSLSEPLLGANSHWFAIVLLTIAVRAVLLPLTVRQIRSMRTMRAIQPALRKLQERHADDRAKLVEETGKLTREHGVSPLAGCLPLLVQAPVFLALSRIMISPVIDGEPNVLRGHLAFGIDLGSSWGALDWADRLTSPGGLLILGLIALAAVTTSVTQRLSLDQQTVPVPPAQRRLLLLLPLVFPLLWVSFPLAAIVYWVTSNLWTLGQQVVVTRSGAPSPVPEPAARPEPSG